MSIKVDGGGRRSVVAPDEEKEDRKMQYVLTHCRVRPGTQGQTLEGLNLDFRVSSRYLKVIPQCCSIQSALYYTPLLYKPIY
jgi:hypothetical protein